MQVWALKQGGFGGRPWVGACCWAVYITRVVGLSHSFLQKMKIETRSVWDYGLVGPKTIGRPALCVRVLVSTSDTCQSIVLCHL
jgi:hypothetical protein